jgi:hypothetical protein
MFIAVLLFNIVHPGAVMSGAESSIPGCKERKRMFEKGKGANNTSETELGLINQPYQPLPDESQQQGQQYEPLRYQYAPGY